LPKIVINSSLKSCITMLLVARTMAGLQEALRMTPDVPTIIGDFEDILVGLIPDFGKWLS